LVVGWPASGTAVYDRAMTPDTGCHPIGRWPIVIGMAMTLLASACFYRPSGPESRAAYFVEKLVREPQAVEDLRAVTGLDAGKNVDSIVDTLPARTAIGYLRSRARLGTEYKFHATRTGKTEPERRLITVSVSEGLAIGATPAILFEVEMNLQNQEWKVVRLRAN